MKAVLIITFLFSVHFSRGQAEQISVCKIEIYLLNKSIKAFDTTRRVVGKFNVKKEDLQDTAFIKDNEIISYTIEKYKLNRKRKYWHKILLSGSIDDRIKRLGDIPLCCGIKYALVINDEVAYSGYLWNPISSFTSTAITSSVHRNEILVTNMYQTKERDPRNNPVLFSCLKKSNRLILEKEKAD